MRILFFFLLFAFSPSIFIAQDSVLDYVDPFIGTGGHGHTFPGATLPFGMVQLSPDTRLTGWDGCGGYHYSDDKVYGFSHTHLSGTGVSDYGDILLMPFSAGDPVEGETDTYPAVFDKKTEKASPGYYTTHLTKDDIVVELSTTLRAGLHKYVFAEDKERNVLLDLAHRDKVIDASMEITSESEIIGYRHSDNWARDQRLFFVIQFSEKFLSHELRDGNKTGIMDKSAQGESIKATFNFAESSNPLMIRVGISAVDIAGARKNLESEINHWDFEKVKSSAEEAWKKELSKIGVKDKDEEKKTIFYTALYHTMIAPNLYSDVDGRYRGTDLEIHKTEGHNQYTVFSLWDTYRATHPLYTLIDQKRTTEFIKTFLNQYEQGGQLPMWELAGNYTGCMIGYHAVPVISDAYMKGIRDFDADKALEAMIASATTERLGIKSYAESGLLTTAQESESVSKTLEYAYDDWTIARMADEIGKSKISSDYYRRAQFYKNVFDPETGFMRARSNNRWFHPFDPSEVNFNYTEANAWQYSCYVPQDVEGWMDLLGGEKAAEKRLDEIFMASSSTSGRHQADITGLIGQYAHGNEPSHHMAYLYNYVGAPHKTQKRVRQIMDELYQAAPDGLSGNEDCGQMSAWLVMSAMGFYPVAPGSNEYIIGSPWFDLMQINLENGNAITIEAENNKDKNVYVQEIYDSESYYDQTYLDHALLMEGPYLYFKMGSEPSARFGKDPESRPESKIPGKELVAVPAISAGERSFRGSTEVTLTCATKDAEIYYQLDGESTRLYKSPIKIDEDATLITWAQKNKSYSSPKAKSIFTKMDADKELSLLTEFAPQYSAGGDRALIDKIRGGEDFRNGVWQGYEGVDLVAIVDLGKKKKISEIRVGFLQDENSWIFMPTELQVYTGTEDNWELLGDLINDKITPKERGAIVKDFVVRGKAKSRYLKIVAKNRGVCPEYHKGAGNKCWVFADEIVVK